MAAPKGNDYRARGIGRSALERFLSKCVFDPVTGCVLWTGGTTSGRGHSAPYGSFWFEGSRWFAHRWAAKHIHGHDIAGLQVEHFCPHIPHPNTLCVHHVHPISAEFNRELQTLRGGKVDQNKATRMFWIYVQVELEPPPPVYDRSKSSGVPFYDPPDWFRPSATTLADCPF